MVKSLFCVTILLTATSCATFVNISPQNRMVYEHFISLDLAWKFRLF